MKAKINQLGNIDLLVIILFKMNTTRSGFNLDGQKGVIEISNESYLSKSSDSTAIDVLTSLHQYGPKLYEKVTKKRKVSFGLGFRFFVPV